MTYAERVVFTFVALRKWRETVFLFDRRNTVAAAGENLVRIALMTDVPHEPIVGRVV